jgi:recombinational DNA repair protein RecR
MASASDEAAALDLLALELEHAGALIAALQRALREATGAELCESCYRERRSEACPWCTGIEGKGWP